MRPIVSRNLGVLRNAGTIDAAISGLLPFVDSEVPSSDPAVVALLIAVFALQRKESRGGHARSDFPSKLPTAQRRVMRLAETIDIARSTASHPLARSA